MSAPTLEEIEKLVEELDPADQVRLQRFLAQRMTKRNSLLAQQSIDPETAWQRFEEACDRLAATSVPGAPSLTEAVSQMRR